MNNIKQNLALINQKIDSLKSPTKVVLVAVSKQQNASKIIEAVECGQTIFGENYLQEALKKQQILQKYKLEWHFIGPIQSNKCKSIAENFSWVHTIDRLKIASRINDARKNMGAINICIQINISNEETKSGVRLGDAKEFINEISKLDNLTIRGLMAIPSNTNNEKLLAKEFQLLGNIYEEFKKIYPTIDTLSMGMSNDYLNAINHGANMVRIGSNIFGART
jgi:PLP dependent protein